MKEVALDFYHCPTLYNVSEKFELQVWFTMILHTYKFFQTDAKKNFQIYF